MYKVLYEHGFSYAFEKLRWAQNVVKILFWSCLGDSSETYVRSHASKTILAV